VKSDFHSTRGMPGNLALRSLIAHPRSCSVLKQTLASSLSMNEFKACGPALWLVMRQYSVLSGIGTSPTAEVCIPGSKVEDASEN
jgi:hypothetical protein